MRKVVIAALAATFAISPAIASPSESGNNAVSAKQTGQTAARYSALGVDWLCNETKHARFETISCTLSAPVPTFVVYDSNWVSDFNGQTGTFTFTVSDDGLTLSGHATY